MTLGPPVETVKQMTAPLLVRLPAERLFNEQRPE
jgi:hypothetical protein